MFTCSKTEEKAVREAKKRPALADVTNVVAAKKSVAVKKPMSLTDWLDCDAQKQQKKKTEKKEEEKTKKTTPEVITLDGSEPSSPTTPPTIVVIDLVTPDQSPAHAETPKRLYRSTPRTLFKEEENDLTTPTLVANEARRPPLCNGAAAPLRDSTCLPRTPKRLVPRTTRVVFKAETKAEEEESPEKKETKEREPSPERLRAAQALIELSHPMKPEYARAFKGRFTEPCDAVTKKEEDENEEEGVVDKYEEVTREDGRTFAVMRKVKPEESLPNLSAAEVDEWFAADEMQNARRDEDKEKDKEHIYDQVDSHTPDHRDGADECEMSFDLVSEPRSSGSSDVASVSTSPVSGEWDFVYAAIQKHYCYY